MSGADKNDCADWCLLPADHDGPCSGSGQAAVVDGDPRKTLTDGRQIYPEHRNIVQDGPRKGQQQDYVVLSQEERAKGFVRPVRRSYVHAKCGVVTTMGPSLAETYARQPDFYTGTFCSHCQAHFPVGAEGEFVWAGTDEKVGT